MNIIIKIFLNVRFGNESPGKKFRNTKIRYTDVHVHTHTDTRTQNKDI